MAGRNRENSLQHRHGLRHTSEQHVRSERVLRNLLWHDAACQQSAHFRGKRKTLRCLRVIKRFDAQWISRQEEQRRCRKSSAQVEQRKRKHATQLHQALFAPLLPGVHQNFRIGLCCESMSEQCQAFPEFAVIIKLAVVDDSDIPRFVPDWLPASSQVNDAEPAHAQGQPRSPRLSGQGILLHLARDAAWPPP